MELHSDWSAFLSLLNSNRVRFLVVGAHALAAHGQPRFTGDLDIFIERSLSNAKAVRKTLDELGFKAIAVSIEELKQPNFVVRLGRPPVGIDLLTGISGVTFKTAWKNRSRAKIGNVLVCIIGRTEFIRNKRAAGRAKDLLDIELLKPV
jgi:Nucleotidyl transferase of unknown function (DUF2204)